MSLNVYTAEYIGVPNHIGVFLETEDAGPRSGILFNVVGTVVIGQGQTYEEETTPDPADAPNYVQDSKKFIGTIDKGDIDRFRTICKSIPVPGPQLKLNGTRIDPTKPLRRCMEWTAEAIEALFEDGVLKK